jgi:coatomer subunit zeta
MVENVISLYRPSGDAFFYVNGPSDENELLLLSVLSGLYESLAIILRFVDLNNPHLHSLIVLLSGQIDKRMILENFDALLLTIDEMVDRGYAAIALISTSSQRFVFSLASS